MQPIKLIRLLTILGLLIATLGFLLLLFYGVTPADYGNNLVLPVVRIVASIMFVIFALCYIWGKNILRKIDDKNRESARISLWVFKNQPFIAAGEGLICVALLLLL